MKFKMKKVT